MSDPLIITGLLSNYFRESVVVAIAAGFVLLRFRRYKQVSGAAVGAVSTTGTAAVAVLITLLGLVALGYWDPPVSSIISDGTDAARGVYQFVVQPAVDILTNALRAGRS
ncbi:hypothetical protein EXE48_18055 [Halorubrum sp. ASP1]|uniref:hypothetical protein n=1 Tax=Halorubrum sp. ASP1 TaxID=2518114 RepID=UPI0010F5C831|nr:hypothetical protein [Halorubrum sp. ASP1]TKX57449.1 hypothetical protein EXE48_18055 [Halorubrum sp. ASP1]